MKRLLGTVSAVALAFGLVGTAMSAPLSATKSAPENRIASDAPAARFVDVPYVHSNDLDEQIGDTVWVGTTWRDMQHNGTVGRMIAIDNSDPENPAYHVSWCYRETAEASSDTRYAHVIYGDSGPEVETFNGSTVNTEGWGAYQEIYADPVSGAPYINFHGPGTNGWLYDSMISSESPFVPGFFQNYRIPHYNDVEGLWPHMDIANNDGTTYFHVLVNGYDVDDTKLFYHRAMYDPAQSMVVSAMPDGVTQLLVSDQAMNLSGTVAASDDGNTITLAQTVSRWLQGEGPDSWDGTRMSQSDNDIYLWTSTDGGVTWDFENPVNATNFIAPDENLLPDTTAANKDTLRAYTNIDVNYDADNTLHMVFNVLPIDFYRTQGESGLQGRAFYWNDQDQTFSEIADGMSWFNSVPCAWELTIDQPNVVKDDDTGILWAMWVQYGVEGDTVEGGWSTDVSTTGLGNPDLFVSASPDNGRHWTEGVNVTETHGLANGDMQPGEAEGEREASMVTGDGDPYLHLFYTLDRDGGIAAPATDDGAVATNNPQVYQRVPKQELLDLFEENAQWHRNYPLHVDSTDMYIDPDDWAWNGFWNGGESVGEGNTLQPNQFNLEQNYPNPFNPSTQIAFNLKAAGNVKLAVYDVLGREVATLVNRGMAAGHHTVNFLAEDLPSGVYFYKLTSGSASQVRKMVLMK